MMFHGQINTTGHAWTTAGGDYSLTNAGTITVANGSVSAGTTIASSELKNMVSAWVATPASNNGMVIISAENLASNTNVQFSTRTSAAPPRLLINYTTPATCVVTPDTYLPIVYPDAAVTSSNLSVTVDVLANDKNYYEGANGHANTLQSVSAPAHGGSATIVSGKIVYTPGGAYTGIETLTYVVADGAITKYRYSGHYRNEVAPTVLADVISTTSNTAKTIIVGANDSDPQGTISAPAIVSNPANGTVTVVGNDVLYTPSANFCGNGYLHLSPFRFCQRCMFNAIERHCIGNHNSHQPTAGSGPGTINTFACVDGTVKVADIASDPEAGTLSATIAGGPAHGSVVPTRTVRLSIRHQQVIPVRMHSLIR